MARCPWEAGLEIDNSSPSSTPDKDGPVSPPTQSTIPHEIVDAHAALHSHWRKDTTYEILSPLAGGASYGPQWTKPSSSSATWALGTLAISSSSDSEQGHFQMDLFNSTRSFNSPGSPPPTLPDSFDTSFNAYLPANSRLPLRPGLGGLMINTYLPRPVFMFYISSPIAAWKR